MSNLPNLAAADWLRAPMTQTVLAALRAAGHEGRVVGGAVRNALMGKPVGDIDIATTALPKEVIRAAKAAGLHVLPTGLQHGTVTVVCDHTPHEVTTLRRDVATDGRHATVAFTSDWAADAARRDFTFNALYCDAAGRVHDPLGGYPDLVARRVRFIGSADARIAEDYLRILRFFRFHAEHSSGPPDAEGLAACLRGRHGLDRLSGERIRVELMKLAIAPGALATLGVMAGHGLLGQVLGCEPGIGELARLTRIEAALALPADALQRLGCLMPDTAEAVAQLERRLRLSKADCAVLAAAVQAGDLGLSLVPPEAAAKVILYALGPAAWGRAVPVRWARSGAGQDDAAWRALWELPLQWAVPVFPVAGRDLLALGLPPGPAVGAILRQLEAEWIAGGFAAHRAALLERARALLA